MAVRLNRTGEDYGTTLAVGVSIVSHKKGRTGNGGLASRRAGFITRVHYFFCFSFFIIMPSFAMRDQIVYTKPRLRF